MFLYLKYFLYLSLIRSSLGFDFQLNQGTEVGDLCIIENTQTEGICKLVKDCPEIVKLIKNRNRNFTVCGYEGINQIGCCSYPDIIKNEIIDLRVNEKISNIDNYDCVDNKTGYYGVKKFLKYCPSIKNDIENGAHIPSICDHEICSDIVCCPIENNNRLKLKCKGFDDPSSEILYKLQAGLPCKIRGTNVSGNYQRKCKKLEDIEKKGITIPSICEDPICKGWYCCPNESNEKTICNIKSFYDFDDVEIKAGSCIDSKTGKKGTCRPITQCPIVFEEILEPCGTACCTDFYCCPDIDENKLSKSNKYCAKYSKSSYANTLNIKLQTDLFDFNECTNNEHDENIHVSPKEYLHMANLGYLGEKDFIKWECGGSLISDRFVLTAAQCINHKKFGLVKLIRLGMLNTNITKDSKDCPEDFFIENFYKHPDYNENEIYNDIALIKLDRKVIFNTYILPMCLPNSPEISMISIVTGWYQDSWIKVFLSTYNSNECRNVDFKKINQKFTRGFDQTTQLCLGNLENMPPFPCPTQPGSSLFINHQKFYRMNSILGISSYSDLCGMTNTPAVYTKIYPYVKWIESIIWESF